MKCRSLRTERRSRRIEVRWEVIGCSRRWTTRVVDWSNDTLSKEHMGSTSSRENAKRNAKRNAKNETINQTIKWESAKKKKNQNTEYIIQDIVHPKQKSTPTSRSDRFFFFCFITVTVVRFPIEEKRVETECAERAFERSSADPRKRKKSALGGILYRKGS